ncbi:MAG: hypothetical protein AB7I35_15825 [Ramlibacter sp.]
MKHLPSPRMSLGLVAAAWLAGCAGPATAPPAPRYHCEHGIEFTVRFIDDSAVLDGVRGREVLYRDAGGLAPGQTVYSNTHMRAEFGLGASGREAIVRYPLLPLAARCARD